MTQHTDGVLAMQIDYRVVSFGLSTFTQAVA